VAVVSTDGDGGRIAQTVSAVCSVSADPPTLLVCINRASPVPDVLRANGVLGVSLLAAGQEHVAETFAGRPPGGLGAYDFAAATWTTMQTGTPLVCGAVAVFDCALERVVDVASHVIVVARVLSSAATPHVPLTYCDAAYGRHASLAV
jgi:flavin reductase (DIM6/NTAB) family NADH-FMN oxidoreductase RutF